MRFQDELASLLPQGLPNRQDVVDKAATHLELIVEANRYFNLTRITDPREAAIKHVLDSVMPWQLFAGAGHVVDAGSGAGFPGIPLALMLTETQFTLAESVGKKARFLQSAVEQLMLPNVSIAAVRAEEVLRSRRAGLLTFRAVAPISRAVGLFGPAFYSGLRALLYKGPDVEAELNEAKPELRKRGIRAQVVYRYDLPEASGARSIVELRVS